MLTSGNDTGEKGPAMNADPLQSLPSRRAARREESTIHLISCSVCLRVLRGSQWLEAERVIREIRSYELENPPRLASALCDICAESIFSRRAAAQLEAA
jgi:hypothetical protein